jgi:hypothetical protein
MISDPIQLALKSYLRPRGDLLLRASRLSQWLITTLVVVMLTATKPT